MANFICPWGTPNCARHVWGLVPKRETGRMKCQAEIDPTPLRPNNLLYQDWTDLAIECTCLSLLVTTLAAQNLHLDSDWRLHVIRSRHWKYFSPAHVAVYYRYHLQLTSSPWSLFCFPQSLLSFHCRRVLLALHFSRSESAKFESPMVGWWSALLTQV